MKRFSPEMASRVGTILILEDEGIVSMLIEDIARDMGATDVHVFSDIEAARLAAANNEYDCAVLDLRVRGGDSTPVADLLAERGIPFMFSTGAPTDQIVARHRDRPVLSKPFADEDLRTVLAATVFAPLTLSEGQAAE